MYFAASAQLTKYDLFPLTFMRNLLHQSEEIMLSPAQLLPKPPCELSACGDSHVSSGSPQTYRNSDTANGEGEPTWMLTTSTRSSPLSRARTE